MKVTETIKEQKRCAIVLHYAVEKGPQIHLLAGILKKKQIVIYIAHGAPQLEAHSIHVF